jgi:hypothetical protein
MTLKEREVVALERIEINLLKIVAILAESMLDVEQMKQVKDTMDNLWEWRRNN